MEIPEPKKRSDSITVMIDGYLNDLARVGVNSNTGDSMDLIADYWDEIMRKVPDGELLKCSAEILEPMKSLGDVIGLYVQMVDARAGFYNVESIENARGILVDSENSMITLLRNASECMMDAPRSKAESSRDYLKLKTSEALLGDGIEIMNRPTR